MTKRVFIAVLLVALAVAANAPGAFAQTVNASADSWVTERYPNRNYGTQTTMRVAPTSRGSAPSSASRCRALDGAVERAVLRIYSQNGAPDGLRVFSTAGRLGRADASPSGTHPPRGRSSAPSPASRRRTPGGRST